MNNIKTYGSSDNDYILVVESLSPTPETLVDYINNNFNEFEITGSITPFGKWPDIYFMATLKRKDDK